MKTRIISGLIGVVILFIVLSQFHTWIFNVTLFALYTIAVTEINNAFREKNVKRTSRLLHAAGVVVLLFNSYEMKSVNYMLMAALFAVGFATIVVFNFEKINFMTVAAEIAFGTYVLFGFWSILRFKYLMPYTPFGWDGAFMLILTAVIAWGGDVFAYFAGYFFGKHKLAPVLSPKKTKEGAVGGVVGSVLLTCFILWAYSMLKPLLEGSAAVYSFDMQHMLIIGIIAACGSVVGMIGDLFASAVKRNVGIKDYGNLMPGHGGVMDRFDSVLLVAPIVSSFLGIVVNAGGIFNV